MASDKHLLVPIKIQALVIDDLVIEKKAIIKIGPDRNVANDGKWSPLRQDYRRLINALGPPGPPPFYGASRTAWSDPADQLVLGKDSPALPKPGDRGVYLHWVLPPGLRHAHRPGVPEFPALPDQWLIVRFTRRGSGSQTKAWFLDSGLVANRSEPANLLVAQGNKYVARQVGKAVALEQFDPAAFQGERTVINAIGNRHTGSPTFTAFVAENRNVFSWHDDLSDLRQTGGGKMPNDAALSYLLLGWYRDEQNEPSAALPPLLQGKSVLDALRWAVDGGGELPGFQCLFHGMTAQINYWNQETYKGPMLGYPGAPSVEGVLGDAPPSFKVGVANNAEDALVSLVSSEYSGPADAPNLWKALEAVLYRNLDSLAGSWNATPRDHAVHQTWFSSREAGKAWEIRPRPQNAPAAEPTPPEPNTVPAKPTPEQFAALAELNHLQAEADMLGRELAALQQDLYGRWWMLCEKSRRDAIANLDNEEDACRALAGRVSDLRGQLAEKLNGLERRPEELAATLAGALELRSDAAPRFWIPADPVIVLKNCGLSAKHAFPAPLPCRRPERIVTMAEVTVDRRTTQFRGTDNVQSIAALASKHFAARGGILKQMLEEASIVEQAIGDAADRSLPGEKRFFAAGAWKDWVRRLQHDLTWSGDANDLPVDQIRFGKPGALDLAPYRLLELWGQQPWSPLFIDWQITWRPTPNAGANFEPAWRLNDHDYFAPDRKSLPSKGYTVRGRSILSPIDGRVFDEPIGTLRQLLKPPAVREDASPGKPVFPQVVREILSNYQIVWDKTLAELSGGGLMGQALTGFHQTLLRRDVTLPRVLPDPARPWASDDDLKFRDDVVKALLDVPAGVLPAAERLAPPAPTLPAIPFTMLRAGVFQLDELWLVDDFGQWADLLQGTSAGGSAGQVFHPRVRWHDDRFVVSQPPRVLQPARLNFRFTPANASTGREASSLSAVCGWLFYNPLDAALVLCDPDGHLAGELSIQEEQGGFLVSWEKGAGGVALSEIRNSRLKAFAESLIQPAAARQTRLQDLLKLIDRASERIRPAAGRRDSSLFGRPLALVSAHLGLELFGKAWTDPYKKPGSTRPEGTGDAALDALRIPVNLGCLHNTEDGLVGYFKSADFGRIVRTRLSREAEGTETWPSGYIAHPEADAVRVGFTGPETLTLLMDPWGSVQAACGIVPAKTILLPPDELEGTMTRMEASFRVGPVLVHAGRIALPAPAGEKGRWNFSGPLTGDTPSPVLQSEPRFFADNPVFAAEGHLLLVNTGE